jgi:hypothetical protein
MINLAPKPLVYVFATSNTPIGQPYIAILADTGEQIDGHFCSNLSYAKMDLGRRLTQYEVIYLPIGQIPPQEVLTKIDEFVAKEGTNNPKNTGFQFEITTK